MTLTHSAAAADIDGDGDIDLYNGNIWGDAEIDPQIDPQILLNDGSGKFSVGKKRLPPLVSLNQNGYTTCAFSDIDDDGDPDLILGSDAGDDINNEHSTPNSEVLVNDGKGVFGLLPDSMTAKDHDTSDIAHDIEPVDLNGDAYPDLFMVYEKQPAQGSYIQALVNNRDGMFRNETTSRLDPVDRKVWIPYLELRDLDRDGDMDLLAKHTDYKDPDPRSFWQRWPGPLPPPAPGFSPHLSLLLIS